MFHDLVVTRACRLGLEMLRESISVEVSLLRKTFASKGTKVCWERCKIPASSCLRRIVLSTAPAIS